MSEHPDDMVLELPVQDIQISKSPERPKSQTIQQLFMEKMQIRNSELTFNKSQDVLYMPPSKLHLEIQNILQEGQKKQERNAPTAPLLNAKIYRNPQNHPLLPFQKRLPFLYKWYRIYQQWIRLQKDQSLQSAMTKK